MVGVKSNSSGLVVVVKWYLCMRDAKNRNVSVNAKDFPRQSLFPERKKISIIVHFSGYISMIRRHEMLMFHDATLLEQSGNFDGAVLNHHTI